MSRQSKKHGFTLAELLIALGVLSVIAAFAVPKLLNSNDTSQKKAILKRLHSANILIWDKYRNENNRMPSAGGYDPKRQEMYDYYSLSANYVSSVGAPNYTFYHQDGSLISFSGPMPGDASNNALMVIYDYNGDSGPNTTGEDRLVVVFNVGDQTYVGLGGIAPGKFVVSCGSGCPEDAANQALYDSLYE